MSSLKDQTRRAILLGWWVTDQRNIIAQDVTMWCRRAEREPTSVTDDLVALTYRRELRTVYYFRLEHGNGASRLAAKVLRRLFQPALLFDLAVDHIGPGFYVQHGHGSLISPTRIGANCWIHHNVSIGWSYGRGRPTIGDDVFIGVGAVIVGDLVVGDGATIGANAVVIRDVPPGATVVGVPAKQVGRPG